MKFFNQYMPVSLQQAFKRLMIFVKHMWLPIYRIEQSGLSVILIGHEACNPFSDKVCDPYIMHLLFGGYSEPVRIGFVPVLSLNWTVRRWENRADFVIFRHRKFRPQGALARRMLNIPCHVAQIVELPPPGADLLAAFANSTTRRDLKKIRDAEFQYEMTQDSAQLEYFYHQMFLPYIQDRHRDYVQCMPWEVFKRIFDKAELLLIRKDGFPVAGNLIMQTGNCYTSHAFGVRNADRELLNAGALAACYWFSIVEAHRRGCRTLNMQCARPFLKDGVLAYKKKWGSRIVEDHTDPELWLLPCGNRPSMYRFLEQNPFICEQDGRLVSLIFLGTHTVLNDKELSSYLRGCHYQGKQLSTCVVLLNSEWAARAESIQSVLNELATPNHVLDLSHGSVTELPALIHSWHERIHDDTAEFREPAYSRIQSTKAMEA